MVAYGVFSFVFLYFSNFSKSSTIDIYCYSIISRPLHFWGRW